MARCQVCTERHEAAWAWQPFGPGGVDCFVLPGSHYRGFPVIKVCDAVKERFQAGETVSVRYRGHLYTLRRS